MPFEPHLFDRYYLLELVGTGAMAETFRAKFSGPEGFFNEIAIKRLFKHHVDNATITEMLVNEAKLGVLLKHKNISRVLDLGQVNRLYYMAMEFMDGVPLKKLLELMKSKNGVLDYHQAIYIVSQILDGLHYTHNLVDDYGKPLEIVHCDISPENIMLAFNGDIKIIDFGVAKSNLHSNVRKGYLTGKYNFMSPEQAGGKDIHFSSDIFSVGILLYILITGEHPFGDNDVGAMGRIRSGNYEPPQKYREGIPPALTRIIQKALTTDPENRFQSAALFRDHLLNLSKYPLPYLAEQLKINVVNAFGEEIKRRSESRAHDENVIRKLRRSSSSESSIINLEDLNRQIITKQKDENKEPGQKTSAPLVSETSQAPIAKEKKTKKVLSLVFVGFLGMVFGTLLTMRFLFEKSPNYVVLHTVPPGANVFIDETLHPKPTPFVINNFDNAKKTSFRFVLKGFKEKSIEIFEPKTQLIEINVQLTPIPPSTPVITPENKESPQTDKNRVKEERTSKKKKHNNREL